MALMIWNDQFKVDVREIDEQHKNLIGLLNSLHDAMKVGKGKDVSVKILSDLIDYTVYHFGTEENLFQADRYPGTAKHKAEHEALKKQVIDLSEKFRKGDMVVSVIMSFLKDWLNDHILGSDRKYGAYRNSKTQLHA